MVAMAVIVIIVAIVAVMITVGLGLDASIVRSAGQIRWIGGNRHSAYDRSRTSKAYLLRPGAQQPGTSRGRIDEPVCYVVSYHLIRRGIKVRAGRSNTSRLRAAFDPTD